MRTHPWTVSDELWNLVEPLIPSTAELRNKSQTYQRKPGAGRKSKYDARTYFSAIVYILRNGIVWNALPREMFGGLGSSALHYKFSLWAKNGLFDRIWEAGLLKYAELKGIKWEWQAADGCQIKAPLAQESVGSNPTDRGKKWAQSDGSCRGEWSPAVVRRRRSKSA